MNYRAITTDRLYVITDLGTEPERIAADAELARRGESWKRGESARTYANRLQHSVYNEGESPAVQESVCESRARRGRIESVCLRALQ